MELTSASPLAGISVSKVSANSSNQSCNNSACKRALPLATLVIANTPAIPSSVLIGKSLTPTQFEPFLGFSKSCSSKLEEFPCRAASKLAILPSFFSLLISDLYFETALLRRSLDGTLGWFLRSDLVYPERISNQDDGHITIYKRSLPKATVSEWTSSLYPQFTSPQALSSIIITPKRAMFI